MKKDFLQHKLGLPRQAGAKIAWIVAVGVIALFFIWITQDSSETKSDTKDMLNPIFRMSGFFGNLLTFSKDINAVENEKKELEVKNSLLEARVRELEEILSFSAENRQKGIAAMIASQFPSSPYSTISLSLDRRNGNVAPGMKAVAYGGVYLGNVTNVGDRIATAELLSFPELETDAWLERLSLNVAIVGEGSNNMKFELPKDIKVEIGDKIFSNTIPQYLIGEIEIIENRPTEPLQEIRFRHPLNFRNLRYVELFE